MAAFWEQFNKAPPQRMSLLDWEKQEFALGCVKDRSRSGRKTWKRAAVATSLNIPQVSDSNQIMVGYWSVYGDFSPTLYIPYC
jgi:hypothetical protein